MPRAFCPECGSEVPVDTDGVCHVGHVIDLSTANVRADGSPEPDAEAAATDPNEPEPWVASVDRTTLGGYTPPPDADAAAGTTEPPADIPAPGSLDDDLSGLTAADDLPLPPSSPASPPPVVSATPDEAPYEPATFELGASDDLAAAAAAAAATTPAAADFGVDDGADDDIIEFSANIEDGSDGDALGWKPPTESPVAGAPIPPPAPVDPPAPAGGETLSGEFDLDDLEAAVSELSGDPAPAAPTAPAPPAAPAAAEDDLDVLSAFDEPEPAAPAADLPPPAAPTREIPPLAPPVGAPADADDAAEPPAPAHRLPAPDAGPADAGEPEDVDLSHFTAKGSRGSGSSGGGLKGLFRKR